MTAGPLSAGGPAGYRSGKGIDMDKLMKAIGMALVMVILFSAMVMAGEVATRTPVLTAPAATGGGSVTWTNNLAWSSAEVLYVQAWNMLGGNASTLTVSRVSSNYSETLGTMVGNAATSNGILALKTANCGKDLIQGDKIQIAAQATNFSFKADITLKALSP
jgi:hypothetical protein